MPKFTHVAAVLAAALPFAALAGSGSPAAEKSRTATPAAMCAANAGAAPVAIRVGGAIVICGSETVDHIVVGKADAAGLRYERVMPKTVTH